MTNSEICETFNKLDIENRYKCANLKCYGLNNDNNPVCAFITGGKNNNDWIVYTSCLSDLMYRLRLKMIKSKIKSFDIYQEQDVFKIQIELIDGTEYFKKGKY